MKYHLPRMYKGPRNILIQGGCIARHNSIAPCAPRKAARRKRHIRQYIAAAVRILSICPYQTRTRFQTQ